MDGLFPIFWDEIGDALQKKLVVLVFTDTHFLIYNNFGFRFKLLIYVTSIIRAPSWDPEYPQKKYFLEKIEGPQILDFLWYLKSFKIVQIRFSNKNE